MSYTTAARLRFFLAALAALATLQGCGGGGDASGSPPPPPASTDAQAAYRALLGQRHAYSLNGSAQGVSFNATLQFQPGADVQDHGMTYATAAVTSTMSSDGRSLGSGTQTFWLDKSSGNAVFYTMAPAGACGIVTPSGLPTSAALGSSGPMYVASEFQACSSPDQAVSRIGTSTVDWSYTSVSGLGYLCLNSTVAASGVSEADCVEVSAADGTLGTHFRVVLTDPSGITLTLTN
jgi:hypothetical protein